MLNFSNRTFAEFFLDNFGVDIDDAKYDRESGSTATRMRAFWEKESNSLVGKVLELLFREWKHFAGRHAPSDPPEECREIVRGLLQSAPVSDLVAVAENAKDQSIGALARSVRAAIDRNEPESGLDRLHTFVVKYIRKW